MERAGTRRTFQAQGLPVAKHASVHVCKQYTLFPFANKMPPLSAPEQAPRTLRINAAAHYAHGGRVQCYLQRSRRAAAAAADMLWPRSTQHTLGCCDTARHSTAALAALAE